MILDVNDLAESKVLTSDVCIIGSGAAGITLAREFAGTRTSVIILEGGGPQAEAASQDIYRSSVVGLKHNGIQDGRARVLGGSTTLWAGQALPLFPLDFEERDWVPYSGWPIGLSTLAPYYCRAEQVMQLPHVTNDPETWPFPQIPPPRYDPNLLETFFSQFTSTPNFIQKYRAELAEAPNIQLITHANAVALEANQQANSLRQVQVRSFHEREFSVSARFFIVCVGGIESARLLLLSNSVERDGIGNSRDVVGRFFQDHPGLAVPITALNRSRFRQLYDSVRIDGVRYSVKLSASPELQRREKILHMGNEVFYPVAEDDPIEAAKGVLKTIRGRGTSGSLMPNLGRVLQQPHKVFRATYRYYTQGTPTSVGNSRPHLGGGGEQQPNPISRVILGTERDALGMPRAVLDWRLTPNDTRSFDIYTRTVDAEWKRLEIATLDLDKVELKGRENGEHGGFGDGNHHMGTTRMGRDRKTSVVDTSCRVHGYDNLYIGSSSVFPTGGFSNPTLTIIALSIRIADEIKQSLAGLSSAEIH